jgi:hypothetical protein
MKSERPERAALRRHARAQASSVDVVPDGVARAASVTTTKQGDTTMSDSDDPKNGAPPSRFSPSRLRLSQDFDQLAGVTKLITTVPVKKPDPLCFVRVHPDPAMSLVGALLLDRVDGRETFLVDPSLYAEVATVAKVKVLYTAITRQGVAFLWPVGMAGNDGRTNAWNTSAQQAAETARTRWVRVNSNLALGAYDIYIPQANLPEPEWPDLTLEQFLELGFRDRFIDAVDHPVLKQLRGEM